MPTYSVPRPVNNGDDQPGSFVVAPRAIMQSRCATILVEMFDITDYGHTPPKYANHVSLKIGFVDPVPLPARNSEPAFLANGLVISMRRDESAIRPCGRLCTGNMTMVPVENGGPSEDAARVCAANVQPGKTVDNIVIGAFLPNFLQCFAFKLMYGVWHGSRDFMSQALCILERKEIISTFRFTVLRGGPVGTYCDIRDTFLRVWMNDNRSVAYPIFHGHLDVARFVIHPDSLVPE